MSRTLGFLLFFAIAVALLSLAHWYVWARLVRDPQWPRAARVAGTAGVLVLGVVLPLSLLLSRVATGGARPLVWISYVWLGLVVLLVTLLGAGDLIRGGVHVADRLASVAGIGPSALLADPERRLFLARLWAGTAVATAGVAGGHGLAAALGVPAVKRLEVGLARLPAALSGTTVVQLSDLHIGPTLRGDWLARVVAEVNALAPDIVAITGDLVDGSVPSLRDAVAPLARLRSRWGVYFVTGNHEYYSGVHAWMRELERLGVRVLRNERVTIGAPGAAFDLAGIDDASSHRFGEGHGPDLEGAVRGRDPALELVLLAHQPKAVDEAERLGVGLQLSGHTHGGQMWPWGYAVRLQQPYVAGLVRRGDTQLYVSRGTGFWGPPMRVGAPSEITRIELVAARVSGAPAPRLSGA